MAAPGAGQASALLILKTGEINDKVIQRKLKEQLTHDMYMIIFIFNIYNE